jgi:hypothetical protein
MALKAIYENVDDIPEVHRDLYSERDGKHVLTGVEGIKFQSDVDNVMTSLTKERNDHKATKLKYSSYSKLLNHEGKPFEKAEDLQAVIDSVPELKAAAEAGGSKSAEAVARQVEAAKKTLETTLGRQVAEVSEKFNKAQQRIDVLEDQQRKTFIRDNVLKEIMGSKIGKFEPDAIEDALMYADRHLETEEERDEDGNLTFKSVRTRDGVGVTPGLEPAAWLAEMQPRKGHWYLPSEGTDSRGNKRNSNNMPNNPWSVKGWNMTAQGQYYKEHGEAKAQQMAQAAGTTLFGPPPAGATADNGVIHQPNRGARR